MKPASRKTRRQKPALVRRSRTQSNNSGSGSGMDTLDEGEALNCQACLIQAGGVGRLDEAPPIVKWPGIMNLSAGPANVSVDHQHHHHGPGHALSNHNTHHPQCNALKDDSSVDSGFTNSPDGHSGQKSPHKEVSPKMNKSRNEKFHKLFKTIPGDEAVLNAYSCAYFGDILLQGNLYISPNWFCFHSRILGHEKFIEIHVTKVVNITREKTAFIIPNAIGIRTAEDKFVFGSLMSRDNTYKLMVNVWKQARTQLGMLGSDNKDLNDEDISDINPSLECDEEYCNAENNNLVMTQSQALEVTEESSESDANICDRCGKMKGDQCSQGCLKARFVTSVPKPNSVSSLDEKTREKKTKDYIPFSIISRPISAASKIVSNMTGMPRTSLLLIICGLLVLLLMLSAAVMTYKIMVLQARIDGSAPWTDPKAPLSGDALYRDVYYLNTQYHTATVERFHSVVQANIKLLGQVHSSLKSLQTSPLIRESSCHRRVPSATEGTAKDAKSGET